MLIKGLEHNNSKMNRPLKPEDIDPLDIEPDDDYEPDTEEEWNEAN